MRTINNDLNVQHTFNTYISADVNDELNKKDFETLKQSNNKKVDDKIKTQRGLNTDLLNTTSAKPSLADFNTFETNINSNLADNKQELTDYSGVG